MKRSTHSDRTAAWAAKQNTSRFRTKTNISAADVLRHKAIESSLKEQDEGATKNETPSITKNKNPQD